MRAQFDVHIGPQDVGQRVSVRARTEDGFRDAVGWLRRWSDGVLEIERRDGRLTHVAEAELVAGKVLGPPPLRRQRP